jgi:hypothetical protein
MRSTLLASSLTLLPARALPGKARSRLLFGSGSPLDLKGNDFVDERSSRAPSAATSVLGVPRRLVLPSAAPSTSRCQAPLV